MNLYREAKAITQDAINESREYGIDPEEYIRQTCDSHEVSIYHCKGIDFCADQDTSEGEAWLEECGSIIQAGDTFGQIACRIAFATLYCACLDAYEELKEESD